MLCHWGKWPHAPADVLTGKLAWFSDRGLCENGLVALGGSSHRLLQRVRLPLKAFRIDGSHFTVLASTESMAPGLHVHALLSQ